MKNLFIQNNSMIAISLFEKYSLDYLILLLCTLLVHTTSLQILSFWLKNTVLWEQKNQTFIFIKHICYSLHSALSCLLDLPFTEERIHILRHDPKTSNYLPNILRKTYFPGFFFEGGLFPLLHDSFESVASLRNIIRWVL